MNTLSSGKYLNFQQEDMYEELKKFNDLLTVNIHFIFHKFMEKLDQQLSK